MVTVSVIIPNYNRAQVIGETIANMLQQTLPPHQLIVVDDGSTDDSVDVIKSFGDRVTLIQQPNRGPGAARNAGLRIATGEFIQFMDSDDLASLNKLEVQAQALTQHQADIVYGPWAKAWMRDRHIRLDNVVLQQNSLPSHRHPLHWFLTSWSMVFQQCLVRRSALEAVGYYREDMRLYEDSEYFLRLLLSGVSLIHESQTLTIYRLNDFGKLTGSGQHSRSGVMSKALFYDVALREIMYRPEFTLVLQDGIFCENIWKSICELQGQNISVPHKSLPSLSEFEFRYSHAYLNIQAWIRQKQKGLQQRIKGHRWDNSYQTGKITVWQRNLIRSMGLFLN